MSDEEKAKRREQSKNWYRFLSEEEKIKKREYSKERYRKLVNMYNQFKQNSSS